MSLGRDRPLSLPWRVTDERTTDVFRAPRGTHDVLPADFAIQRYVGETAARVAALAGYEPIATPVIEDADLFVRSVGDGTDIVEKEMYLFDDRGGDRLALRPESTAAVCRAYLEHGLANQPQPVKLYYEQPNFRYERPQAGRYRQHTQFGIEAIGVLDPALDAEVIELGWRIAEELGLRELTLLLNSIGDAEDRRAYVPLLQEHFRPHLASLCEDCRNRFERAPMRLLDCKKGSCLPYQQGAPHIAASLRPESAAFYAALKEVLTRLAIPFREEPTLVRGLDYYTHTVFELVPAREGSQVTLLAGGRYDGLIEAIGGPATPGIGFGMGIERMALNLKEQDLAPEAADKPDVFIVGLGEEAAPTAARIAADLRRVGLGATMAYGGRSLKAQLRQANRMEARFAVIVGERELAEGVAEIRDLGRSEQHSVALADVVTELQQAAAYTQE